MSAALLLRCARSLVAPPVSLYHALARLGCCPGLSKRLMHGNTAAPAGMDAVPAHWCLCRAEADIEHRVPPL